MATPQYRRLRLDELREVEPQFIRFLSVHGIDGTSWEQMKVNQPGEADALILQFSQMVFDGVIKKVTYLQQRSRKDLRTYHCLPDKIIMNGLLIDGETNLDLTQADLPAAAMIAAVKAAGAQVKLYTAERPYRDFGREQDIFLLMEQGALIADGELFALLEGLK